MLWQGNTLGDWLQKSGTRNTQVVKYIEVFSNDISNLATHESIPMTIMPEGRIVWFGGGGGESNSPSKRSYPESTTSLVSSFISPGQPLLTEFSQASR